MPKIEREEYHDLDFRITVKCFGKKSKLMNDIPRIIGKALWLCFGERFTIADSRGRPIDYDHYAHWNAEG